MQATDRRKLPQADEATLAEVNSELVVAKVGNSNDPSLQRIIQGSPTIYPSIQCGKKESVPTVKGQKPWADRDSDHQALIDIVWNQLSSRFADLQQTGAFHAFDGAWQILAPVIKAIFRDEFAEMLGKKHHQSARNAYIKAVAWHPHREVLAVAHQDDAVFVYQLEGHKWISRALSHEFMVDVACMEWKYRSAGTLAVGARSGVCIWDLYSNTDKMPPHFTFDSGVPKNRLHVSSGSSSGSSSASGTNSPISGLAKGAWMSYLQYPKHTAILSLSWDPTPGSHLLASTAALDSTVVIWDTLTDTATPLRRPDNGLHIVRWSPNGVWIFVASVKGHIRVWETRRWTDKLILNPSGRAVKSACWTPDGANLFYSLRGEDELRMIYFNKAASGIGKLYRCLLLAISTATS
ncbi:WD40-repeat-containing domain protein [Umbelopsis sp. PMI_123]|nr:WD40-repeat-containing domain protein [Umbelopsis sp. PMI_123]